MDSLKKKSGYSSRPPRHTCSVDCNHQTENSRKECGTDGKDVRSEVKPRKYNDDGDDVSTYGRDARSEVKPRNRNDDGDEVSTYGRDARSEVKPRKYNDDGDEVCTYGRDARSEVKPSKYNYDRGDGSQMKIDAIDDEEEEKVPVSWRGREQDEETEPSRSHRGKIISRMSNMTRDGMSEHVTNSMGHMTLEESKNQTGYLNAGEGVVKMGSSVVNGNTSSIALDVRKKITDGKNRTSRKTTTKSTSKHGWNSGDDLSEKRISDGSDGSMEPKTRREETKMQTGKEGKGSSCSVNVTGGGTRLGNAHINEPDFRETIVHGTGQGRSPVSLRRGSTSGGRISADKSEKSGKKSDKLDSNKNRSTGRSSRRSKSMSGSGNNSRSSSKASGTSRSNSRCLSRSETCSSNSRSRESRSSSSGGQSRSSSRGSTGRSSCRGRNGRNRGTSEDSRSSSGSRNKRTSSSDDEEGRKRAQVFAVSASDNGPGQRASKGNGIVQDRKETSKSKQENRSEAHKGNKNTSGRNQNSPEKDISSYSKYSDNNKKSEKPKDHKKEGIRSSSSDKRSGKCNSGSSNKERSKQNKARSRNKSKERNRQDRSDSDEEVRNENVHRSARFSSESTPTKSRIQHKWQYEDEHGWTTYGQIPSTRNTSGAKTVTSDDIELHYLEDNEHCPSVIEINNVQYRLDFQQMTQTNQKTRTRRNIRRVIKNKMDDDSARGSSSGNTFPAHVHRDVTNFSSYASGSKDYSAANNLSTVRPNNYDENRSTNTFANDLSVKHVWQFEDEHGNWITYGKSNSIFDITKATTSNDIEKVYHKDHSKAYMIIQSKNNQYILDFRNMTQTNEQTQVQRRVRRVPEHAAKTSLAEKVKPFAGDLVASGKEYINFEWQFEDEHKVWITYGQTNSAGLSYYTTTVTSDDIEKYYNSLPKKVLMTIKSVTNDYVLDFTSMTQTNEKTSVQRHIRRIPKISRDNKPHEAFGSSSSSALYPHPAPLNSAISNPNSAPSYAMTSPYGGRHATHGQGGGYSGNGSGVGDMPTIHSSAGGGGGGFNNNGSGAGNMHTIQSSAGGKGGGYNDRDVHNIRPGHSLYPTSFKWQFMDEKGFWITYGEASTTGFRSFMTRASSHDIEQHFLSSNGHLPMRIESPTNVYMLDFVNMVQVNIATGAKKYIRRVNLNHAQ